MAEYGVLLVEDVVKVVAGPLEADDVGVDVEVVEVFYHL